MHASSLVLAKNLSGALAPTVCPATPGDNGATGIGTWKGGKAVLIIAAGAFDGTTQHLEMLAPDGATWIAISAKITANGVTAYDLPAGTYRMHTGASNSALYATIVGIPYG